MMLTTGCYQLEPSLGTGSSVSLHMVLHGVLRIAERGEDHQLHFTSAGDQVAERYDDPPKVTQLESGRARI